MTKDMRQSKNCVQCGEQMMVSPCLMQRKKYCSRRCQGAAKIAHLNATRKPATQNAGWFTKGSEPWNKGVPVHLSPKTEFKKGLTPANKVAAGTVRIRTDKSGNKRAWIKTAEPNTWRLRAVVVYEAAYGPIRSGLIVHHKDRDSLNDSLDNLTLLTRSEHLLEHRPDLEEKRVAGLRKRQSKRDLTTPLP